jgi:hypothetical protein
VYAVVQPPEGAGQGFRIWTRRRWKRLGAREQEETFVFYEAPKRRSCDRQSCRRAAAELAAHRRRLLGLSAAADLDSDPTAALLLRIDRAPATASPTQLLALAADASRSSR